MRPSSHSSSTRKFTRASYKIRDLIRIAAIKNIPGKDRGNPCHGDGKVMEVEMSGQDR